MVKLKAPVVVDNISVTDIGTTPQRIFSGSGTANFVFQSGAGTVIGVLFGASTAMDEADALNSFPVPFEGAQWTIGPSTCFVSAICLDGVTGILTFYQEGKTDVTT